LALKRARLFRANYAPTLASFLDDPDAGNTFAQQLEEVLRHRLATEPTPLNPRVQTMVLAKSGRDSSDLQWTSRKVSVGVAGYKAIPSPVDRLDVLGRLPILAERLAERSDVNPQRALLDASERPNLVHELCFAHDLPGPADERVEYLAGTAAQPYPLGAAKEQTPMRDEAKTPKDDVGSGRNGCAQHGLISGSTSLPGKPGRAKPG
jgi:hypothetical protein